MYKNKFNANMDKKRRSQKERYRAWELKMLERAGKIQNLSEQVPFELIPAQEGERAATYIADFTYWKDGSKKQKTLKWNGRQFSL